MTTDASASLHVLTLLLKIQQIQTHAHLSLCMTAAKILTSSHSACAPARGPRPCVPEECDKPFPQEQPRILRLDLLIPAANPEQEMHDLNEKHDYVKPDLNDPNEKNPAFADLCTDEQCCAHSDPCMTEKSDGNEMKDPRGMNEKTSGVMDPCGLNEKSSVNEMKDVIPGRCFTPEFEANLQNQVREMLARHDSQKQNLEHRLVSAEEALKDKLQTIVRLRKHGLDVPPALTDQFNQIKDDIREVTRAKASLGCPNEKHVLDLMRANIVKSLNATLEKNYDVSASSAAPHSPECPRGKHDLLEKHVLHETHGLHDLIEKHDPKETFLNDKHELNAKHDLNANSLNDKQDNVNDINETSALSAASHSSECPRAPTVPEPIFGGVSRLS